MKFSLIILNIIQDDFEIMTETLLIERIVDNFPL